MAEQLGSFLRDEDFKDLFSSQGQPSASPLRLALVTILQFVKGLSDRQVADAMRSRIDWKYLLCLELSNLVHLKTLEDPRAEHLMEHKLLDIVGLAHLNPRQALGQARTAAQKGHL